MATQQRKSDWSISDASWTNIMAYEITVIDHVRVYIGRHVILCYSWVTHLNWLLHELNFKQPCIERIEEILY